MLHQADVALTLCERLVPLAALGKPIRVAIMDSHFAPQGVIREWCARVGAHHGIHAVVLGVGYENYYSNLGSLEASTVAAEDLTAQPELRQPFLGGLLRLRATLHLEPSLDREPDDEVLSWICQDRSDVGAPSMLRETVSRRLAEVRSKEKRVFVAFGKVTIDFAAPGDRGFAHDDFGDWINHLVSAVAGTGNLLIVKPHPHELRQEIVVDGVQLLRSMLPLDLPEEVIFLDHHSFNTHELAGLADVAFVWNGTAALELSVLGVPVVAGSIWAERDYPVGLKLLHSRDDYQEVLRGVVAIEASDMSRRNSATLLRLMRSEYVAIPYRYLRRPATNLAVGAPRLNADQLSQLEEHPDPFVERVASRFFEFS
jgi:capsular polysaccharide export protein